MNGFGSSHVLSNESHQWPKQDPPNGMQSIIQSLAALSPFRSLPSLSKHSSLSLSIYSLNDWDLSIFPAELSEDPEEETVIIKSIISYEKLIGDAKQGAKKKEKAKSMSDDHMNVFVKMLRMVFPAVTGSDDPLFTDVASSYRKYLVMKALCSTFSQAVGVKSFREWLFIDADRYAQFIEFISSMWRWLSCVCRDSFQQQNTGEKKTVELWFHRNNTVKELIQWTSELIETLFVEQSNQQISQLQKSLMPLMMEVITQKNIQKADLLTAFKQFAFTTATDANVYSVEFMKNYDVLASLFRGCIQCKNFEDFSIGVFVFRFTLAIMTETNFIVNDDDLKQMVSRIVKPSTESSQKMFSLLQSCSENVNEEATNTEFARFIDAWMQIDQNDLLIKPSPAIFRCRVKVPDDDDDQEVAIAFLFDDNFSTIHPQTGEIQVTMDNDEMKQFRQPIDAENDIVEIVMNKTMDGESKEESAQLIFNRNDQWLQPFIDVLKKIESAQVQSNGSTMEEDSSTGDTSEGEEDDDRRPTTPLPMKGIDQYDASFTDDEGGDEMDSDEEEGFPMTKKGATKTSVPLYDQKEKKEDEEKKNETKITAKPSANKRKTSKQNEDEETEKKKADDDDDDHVVDDASKKKPKKLKKDEKTPPARSSKKASDEKVDEEKKTESGKQRPTRLTAAKANQKIRDGAKNEQKRSDDEDEQQQEKVEKEFDEDDADQQPKSKSTSATRKRKADTIEKKPTTMKGKKTSIDQTQPQTRTSMQDTDEIKMLQPSMSSIINDDETENIDRLYQIPLKHTNSAPRSYSKSSNHKRNQTAEKFMFQQADTLDARMKISQQETVQSLSRVMENISQLFNDSDRQRKQSAILCGSINKQLNHMQRMMNSHDDEWRNQWEDFSNGAMRVLQITKPLLSVESDHKKRKLFTIDHGDEPQQNTDDVNNHRPLPKYARLNDYSIHATPAASIRRTAAFASNTKPSPSIQRMLNQFIQNIATPTTRPHINSGY